MNALSRFEKFARKMCEDPAVVEGQMFGKRCVKVNGKAFAAFHNEEFVFKLSELDRQEALSLPGSHLWDPSGAHRPMKEWVAIPDASLALAARFGTRAVAFVAGTA